MPMRRFLLALIALTMLTAMAEDDLPVIEGEALRQILSDNTVTGQHDTGMPYSEWHAPDGRVFGHNNREPNDNACWDIRGDAVCYYYAGGLIKGVFCWTFRRITEDGYRLRSEENETRASGIRQAGNPYGFSDNGKPWKCEPLSSQNLTPRPSTRHARR